MKIRIQDNSVRFRISLLELEDLNQRGRIEAKTEILSADGATCEGRFLYAIEKDGRLDSSACVVLPNSIEIRLSPADLDALNDPSQEGVYLKRECVLANGETYRFMAFVEKDRPAARCDKPEQWIYDYRHGDTPEMRPIGG